MYKIHRITSSVCEDLEITNGSVNITDSGGTVTCSEGFSPSLDKLECDEEGRWRKTPLCLEVNDNGKKRQNEGRAGRAGTMGISITVRTI